MSRLDTKLGDISQGNQIVTLRFGGVVVTTSALHTKDPGSDFQGDHKTACISMHMVT